MSNLTEQAYQYASKVKKVNSGVIEAYKFAYIKGQKSIINKAPLELLDLVRGKFRSIKEKDEDARYSGYWGHLPTEKDKKEQEIIDHINSLIEEIKELEVAE